MAAAKVLLLLLLPAVAVLTKRQVQAVAKPEQVLLSSAAAVGVAVGQVENVEVKVLAGTDAVPLLWMLVRQQLPKPQRQQRQR
jgi:hypothetical protein